MAGHHNEIGLQFVCSRSEFVVQIYGNIVTCFSVRSEADAKFF